jgi:hypothetical protein
MDVNPKEYEVINKVLKEYSHNFPSPYIRRLFRFGELIILELNKANKETK